ncbi:hypothetical protein JKA73_10960 [Myxococcus xanthus]|uniref:hypothetical protein n=1 Tax=Myxococcus xanthus TaxID=34 RepID=UPI00191709DE|nr:hypothetical protein [Myxococcus xanthus]QQR46547.1 hypothetical protein JKA73_10960 [Myxococcus xanthus]
MSTEQPPQQDPPVDVRWEAEQYRVVKDGPDHHLEAWDAFGDHSPWWERLDLLAMDAEELRRLLRRLMDTLSRRAGR